MQQMTDHYVKTDKQRISGEKTEIDWKRGGGGKAYEK